MDINKQRLNWACENLVNGNGCLLPTRQERIMQLFIIGADLATNLKNIHLQSSTRYFYVIITVIQPHKLIFTIQKIEIPTYTDVEYQQHLTSDTWTKEETDHLMDLAQRFDLRFIVMSDRYDTEKFSKRSVEDLKDRYYKVLATLGKLNGDKKIYTYDAEHERKRKEQLNKLYERTPEQIEEEQFLLSELKKIDARKKERERKTQDLQKLISQADSQNDTPRKTDKKLPKKKVPNPSRPSRVDTNYILQVVETAGIKFPDYKNSGVSLRSQRMKLPANIGQKKSKGIEQTLQELALDLNPTPSEEVCQHFNELRSDIVLLMEIKSALTTCDYELQSLRHQYEALAPGKVS